MCVTHVIPMLVCVIPLVLLPSSILLSLDLHWQSIIFLCATVSLVARVSSSRFCVSYFKLYGMVFIFKSMSVCMLLTILSEASPRAIRASQIPLVDSFSTATTYASLNRRVVILDVGANTGMFGLAFALHVLRCAGRKPANCPKRRRVELVLFEPELAHQQQLKRVAARIEGTRYLPYAAWTKNTTLRFFRKLDSFRSSVLPHSQGSAIALGEAVTEVPALDLAAFMLDILQLKPAPKNASSQHEAEMRPLVALHLDVEGAELQLLPRLLLSGALCAVTHMLVEFHPMNLDPSQRLSAEGLRLALIHLLNGCPVPPELVLFDEPKLIHINASYTPGLWELAYQRNGVPPSREIMLKWKRLPILGANSPVRNRLSRSNVQVAKSMGVRSASLPITRHDHIDKTAKHIPPPCNDRTAYVGLLTLHASATKSTFLANRLKKAEKVQANMVGQMQLMLVMIRSLRRVERCRRDFILFVDTNHSLISREWKVALDAAGVTRYLPVNPVKLGIPSADKLHAWQLIEYARVLVIDSDIMVLRNLDEAFDMDPSETFVMAHHSYELQQAQCGIPLEKRGVGALFVLRPNMDTFPRLVASLNQFNEYHLAHASEQTALACFFRNQSRTLPCGFLFDLSAPIGDTCTLRRPWTECMRQQFKYCRAFGPTLLVNGCKITPPERCHRYAPGKRLCRAMYNHVATCGEWHSQVAKIKAVHFKGKVKPWVNLQKCRMVSAGALQVQNVDGHRQDISITDTLFWDENGTDPSATGAATCMSMATRKPVLYGRLSNIPIPRSCCNSHSIVAGQWYSFLSPNDPSTHSLAPV